jgi:predicted esterase
MRKNSLKSDLGITHLIILLVLFFLSAQCSKKKSTFQQDSTTQIQITIPTTEGSIESVVLLSHPSSYKKQKSFPLLIALHGYGSNAHAFHDLWKPVTDSLGFVLLTPQGEEAVSNFGWGWGEYGEKIVLSALDMIQRQMFIHSGKIFLAGFSQGGSLCYQIGFSYPNLFRGIAPLAAFYRSEFLPKNLTEIRKLSVYIGQGEQDGHLPEAKEAAEVLAGLGLNVHFEIYKNTGHGIRQPIHDELIAILDFLNH